MLVSSILFLLIFVLLVILSFVWPPDSPWAPGWRTNRRAAKKALTLAKVSPKDTVYELGCGDGEIIVAAATEFGAKAVGIEIDPIRYLAAWSRIKVARLSSMVRVLRKDFKQVSLHDATVVYMYLVPAAMARLLPKLKKELPNGARIISYRYKIPLEKNEKRIRMIDSDSGDKIFVYTVS